MTIGLVVTFAGLAIGIILQYFGEYGLSAIVCLVALFGGMFIGEILS